MARSPAAPVESLGSFFAGARCTGAQRSCSRWRLPPATGGLPPFVEPAARPSLDLPERAIRLRLDRPTVRGRSARKRERSHRAAEPRAAGPGGARWWPYFAWATPKQALCQRPYGRAGARSGDRLEAVRVVHRTSPVAHGTDDPLSTSHVGQVYFVVPMVLRGRDANLRSNALRAPGLFV